MDGQTSWRYERRLKGQNEGIRTEKDKSRVIKIENRQETLSLIKEVEAINRWHHGKVRWETLLTP